MFSSPETGPRWTSSSWDNNYPVNGQGSITWCSLDGECIENRLRRDAEKYERRRKFGEELANTLLVSGFIKDPELYKLLGVVYDPIRFREFDFLYNHKRGRDRPWTGKNFYKN